MKSTKVHFYDHYINPDDNIPKHQFGGHPCELQGDMQLKCQKASNGLYCDAQTDYSTLRENLLKDDAIEWQLVLQLDSDNNTGMKWGNNGRLYFWLKMADMEQRLFENAWEILQPGRSDVQIPSFLTKTRETKENPFIRQIKSPVGRN